MFALERSPIDYNGSTGADAVAPLAAPSRSIYNPPQAIRDPVVAVPVVSLTPTTPAIVPMLNVDRTVSPAQTVLPARSIAPAAPATSTVIPSQSDAYNWLRAHWWLLAALLVLLLIAYAATRGRSSSSGSGSRLARHAKGSPEAKARMAELRARKGQG